MLNGSSTAGATNCEAGLVFKAHILLYPSTLGSRVIKKKKKKTIQLHGLSNYSTAWTFKLINCMDFHNEEEAEKTVHRSTPLSSASECLAVVV